MFRKVLLIGNSLMWNLHSLSPSYLL